MSTKKIKGQNSQRGMKPILVIEIFIRYAVLFELRNMLSQNMFKSLVKGVKLDAKSSEKVFFFLYLYLIFVFVCLLACIRV